MGSSLWEKVITQFASVDLNNFRSIGPPNNRLGTWDPIDGSTGYFKSLMYNLALYKRLTK